MPNPLVSQIEIDNNVYDIKDAEARNKISELKLSDLKTDDNHQFVSKEEKEKWDSGSITIDDTLSDTSENPVQNKVIKGELDKVFQSVSDGKSKIASAIEKLGFAVSGEKTIQCKDGQCKDGKCKDGQCKDAHCKDGQCKDGKCKDGQCKDGKCKDGQCKDGQCKDGKCKDGQCKDDKCKKSEDNCCGDCSSCEKDKCVK